MRCNTATRHRHARLNVHALETSRLFTACYLCIRNVYNSLGLTYRRTDKTVMANMLSASADADHAGADDRRSVSGWAVMLSGAAISWASKRQPVTAISSTELEFYSASQCALECVYVRHIMSLLGFEHQQSDIFTKALPRQVFERHPRSLMGG